MRAPAALAAVLTLAVLAPGPTAAEPPAPTAPDSTAPAPAARVPAAGPVAPPEPTEQRTRCAELPGGNVVPAPPAGHRLLDLPSAWQFSRGAGVTVAVIDTGVSPHPRLRVRPGGDYVSTGDGLDDCDAHGTLVAGLIAGRPAPGDEFSGVAPDATIISIRQSSGAFSPATANRPGGRQDETPDVTVGPGYGPVGTLARAVVRAVDLGADVVNISEVACAAAGTPLGDEQLGAALAYARQRDVVVVVAAGNLTTTSGCREQNPQAGSAAPVVTVATPARFSGHVLTVGAVDSATGAPADFSLRGPWLSVAAPGTSIVSLAPGPGGSRLVTAVQTPDGPQPLTGTSFAAPYVAGTAALIRSRYPGLTADEVVERIVRTAHGAGGRDPAVGFGVVDPVAALTAQLPDAASLPGDDASRAIAPPDQPATGTPPYGVVLGALAVPVALAAVVRRRR